jgi:hypothetical protein
VAVVGIICGAHPESPGLSSTLWMLSWLSFER